MFKCKICNREYKTLDPVGLHLSVRFYVKR